MKRFGGLTHARIYWWICPSKQNSLQSHPTGDDTPQKVIIDHKKVTKGRGA